MRRLAVGIVGILFIFFGITATSFADENEINKLKDQIEKLNKRISELESEMKERPTYVAPPAEAPPGTFVEGALSGIRLSGFVDTAYHWNFQMPTFPAASGTAVTRSQSIGVFDTLANSFTLHAAELVLEKPAPEDGGVGFRTDILAGMDAKVINSTGSEVDEFDLEQAYVEARLANGLYFRAGKYVTLAGAEVIEAKDNWNVTRSLMFGYAIPFTHTGIRASYGLWDDKVTLTTGLNNGWDLLEDNNSYKTWEGQIAWAPNDDFLFTTTMYIGPENAEQGGHKRVLADFVALWHATDKLSLMANFDIANERRAAGAEKAGENAQWHGYALYARYQATDKLAFAGRAELFVDDDVFRIGTSALSTTGTPREHRYWEWTYTTEYKLYENLISRLEYRYNWSEAPIFEGESSQNSLNAQLIYTFA